ncbi:MAG: hypothetical protein AVDCRST_MAG45-919 [uncultured Solirubrobacterales bacterium]|uniref:Uncharacterized protein n=1 Tax=uncultured Solirubrobacterales bacterium TaxID=768556 RepID=A0A6J4SHM9_9ACTN|nr:MAG: hypothetical protein AVDCRST_MAG45-919 [uncultured Solirubrobacterales bacterium]
MDHDRRPDLLEVLELGAAVGGEDRGERHVVARARRPHAKSATLVGRRRLGVHRDLVDSGRGV